MLAADLRELKRQCFGTGDVEVKANWLRRREERLRRYHSRFKTDDAKIARFSDNTYDLIANSRCTLVDLLQREPTQVAAPHRAPEEDGVDAPGALADAGPWTSRWMKIPAEASSRAAPAANAIRA